MREAAMGIVKTIRAISNERLTVLVVLGSKPVSRPKVSMKPEACEALAWYLLCRPMTFLQQLYRLCRFPNGGFYLAMPEPSAALVNTLRYICIITDHPRQIIEKETHHNRSLHSASCYQSIGPSFENLQRRQASAITPTILDQNWGAWCMVGRPRAC